MRGTKLRNLKTSKQQKVTPYSPKTTRIKKNELINLNNIKFLVYKIRVHIQREIYIYIYIYMYAIIFKRIGICTQMDL